MHFTFTEDYPLLTWLLTNPRAYAVIRHDALPHPRDFKVEAIAGVKWVIGWVKELPVAAVMIIRDRQSVQLHFCMTPRVWGAGYAVAQRFLFWFWRLHKGCKEILCGVPGHNRHALRLARHCGFKHLDARPNIGTKDGKPFDLHLFRLRRPEAV